MLQIEEMHCSSLDLAQLQDTRGIAIKLFSTGINLESDCIGHINRHVIYIYNLLHRYITYIYKLFW